MSFHGQPYDVGGAGGDLLADLLDDPAVDRLTIVVAWARYRGLLRLKAKIQAFRARGGKLAVIVGIDEGGATRPGLLGVLQNADEAHIFHDPGGGTFHPKVYLGEGSERAVLVVGSSNLTPGGLYRNVEASTKTTFQLPNEETEQGLVGVRAFISRLLEDPDACRPLTVELVDDLMQDNRYRVAGHERQRRRGSIVEGADPEDVEETGSDDTDIEATLLFERSHHPRTPVPPLTASDREDLAELELDDEDDEPPPPPVPPAPAPPAPAPPAPAPPAPAPPAVRESWAKKLSASDAQQTTGTTNPTGVLRLTQAGKSIDHRTWFRNTMFSDAALQWTTGTDSRGNQIETAQVTFDVTIAGVARGPMVFRVDHAPHREADQNNVPTIVHWDQLADELRMNDHTGGTITIESLDGGGYRMEIA